MPDTTEANKPLDKSWGKRLLWFVALWATGVLSVAAVGALIKWALKS
jgi:hypothetical protein